MGRHAESKTVGPIGHDALDAVRSGTTALLIVLLSVGYACVLSYTSLGPLGQVFLGDAYTNGGTAPNILMLISYVALIGGRLALRGAGFTQLIASKSLLAGSFTATIACYIGAFALSGTATNLAGGCVLGVIAGVAAAVPSVGMVEGFYLVYTRVGSGWCVAAAALSHLANSLVQPLASLVGLDGVPLLLLVIALVTVAWGCMAGMAAAASLPARQEEPPKKKFSSPGYLRFVLLAISFSWGCQSAINPIIGFAQSTEATIGTLLGGLVTSVLLFVLVRRRDEGLHFGSMLRWTTAICGVVWALLPLAATSVPPVASGLTFAAYIAQGVMLPYLVVEIAYSRYRSVLDVAASCLSWFSLGLVLAGSARWVLGNIAADGNVIALTGALCASMLFCVVPFLPSRKSDAGIYALPGFPEERGAQESLEGSMAALAQRCGLSTREVDAMGCMLKGMSRTQIAEEMGISPWTAKGYISKVYAKTGVHSARELMTVVLEGASEENRG